AAASEAFNRSIRVLLGTEIDGLQRTHERRDRFHGDTDNQRCAVGHTSFGPPGVVAAAVEAGRHDSGSSLRHHLVRIEDYFVVDLGASTTRHLETEPNLDPFDRLNAH